MQTSSRSLLGPPPPPPTYKCLSENFLASSNQRQTAPVLMCWLAEEQLCAGESHWSSLRGRPAVGLEETQPASQRDGAEIKERAGTKTDRETERDKRTKMFPLLSRDSQPETIAERRRQKQSVVLRRRPKEGEKSKSLWAK